MADFTPYTAPSWSSAANKWGTTAKSYYTPFPTYERYSGNYNTLENQIYSGLEGRIAESENLARQKYLERQRVLGVGDSPITDVVWGERIAPTYDQRRVDAASSAAQLRANLEMTDLNAYNTAMQSRTAYENALMDQWINNYLTRDLQNWSVNTAAGFQNRAMSAAKSLAESQSDSSLWGAIMKSLGALGGSVMGSSGGLTNMFSGSGGSSGSYASEAGTSLGSGAGSGMDSVDWGGLF